MGVLTRLFRKGLFQILKKDYLVEEMHALYFEYSLLFPCRELSKKA